MRRLFFALPIVLSACLELAPTGGDTTDTSGVSGADSSAPALTGIDCIVESTTGQTICSSVSACPNVVVDHDVFPTCGFRPASGVLDLECACPNSLCPIGIATSCEDAAKLLDGQTQYNVCALEYEGRCTTATGGTSGGTTPKKPCDDDCLIRCLPQDEGCPARCGCAG